MKKVFLSLILVFTTVMGTAQSLDISNGMWTVDGVKSENVDTLFCEVGGNGFVYDMNNLGKNTKFVIVCSYLNINTFRVPKGNWFQELELVWDYRLNRIQRKSIKELRKGLKGTVVMFYELDEYGNPYVPIGNQQNYQVVL